MDKIAELEHYMKLELKFSKPAARRRITRIHSTLASLSALGDYALCRFRKWREAGYSCVPFEGWVFAYEIFDEGVIIRDMSHGKLLPDTEDRN